jgi:hypothetical protein
MLMNFLEFPATPRSHRLKSLIESSVVLADKLVDLPLANIAVSGTVPIVRYERALVVGSVGTLWLGRLTAGTEAGRTVLLRRIPRSLLSPKEIDSLKQIAESYAKVRHPSLVKLLGVIEQDGDIITVSEHLDGVRFSDLLRNAIDKDEPLPATVAVRIVLDAARATAIAHRIAAELGLFPTSRLFVTESVFIAAFGGTLLTETGVLAAVIRCAQPRSIPDLVAQLAPEELDKLGSSKGSPEVFSLGVLLWETLANRYLFSRDSARQSLHELRTLPIPPLETIERCGMPVPEALAEVTRIAACRQGSERYASLDQFVLALEQLPPHFLATEHHVASTLRERAADLLRESHVDSSQSSMMLAFSEVPAGRMSTRPPPADGHNWEPPTFAQRKLVASMPISPEVPRIGPMPSFAQGVVPVASAIPDFPERARRRNRWVWLIASLAVVAALVLLGRFGRSKTPPSIQPEPTAIHPTIAPQPSVESVAPTASTANQAMPFAGSNAAKNERAVSPGSGQQTRSRNDVAPDAPSASPAPEGASSLPMNRKSGATYRPHQIAPYRPRGI